MIVAVSLESGQSVTERKTSFCLLSSPAEDIFTTLPEQVFIQFLLDESLCLQGDPTSPS